MIREKEFLRRQVYLAIDQEDFETARNIMSKICADQPEKMTHKRNWTLEEIEFLMHHVSALGYEKAVKVVAKKLDRTQLSVKKKYYSETNNKKKSKKEALV